MQRGIIYLLVMVVVLTALHANPLRAEESAESTDTTAKNETISLAEVAPELYYSLRRYPKFYGDPNTMQGELFKQTQLLGNVGGVRDSLVEHGIYLDVSVTQFLQGNSSGGNETGKARGNGTADYWLTVDSGKAGLWSGGALFAHAESSWRAGDSVNADTGSLLPANYDAAMPTPGSSEGLVLPELYLVQALPAHFMVLAGKVNWGGLGDNNVFANNERTQFGYTGLVNNPILGAFIPYTSLGVAGLWTPNKEHSVALLGMQSTGDATTSGFGNFNGNYTVGGQYQFSPTFGGDLPGNYRVLAGYDNKELTAFDVDPRHLIAGIIGLVPLNKKSENYALVLNFDQYLWVKGGEPVAGRKGLSPVGVGIFGRAGWTPKDRNVIDQFYSFGIGGTGVLIPGRDHDQWGVGWAGTHISSDVRNIVDVLGLHVDAFEHGFEAYYNIEVTPAVHLTLNTQVINSAVRSVDKAITLGSRLQVDF